MNDKLISLLEQLATKLGTTTEYLWKVLLVQARIDATISLVWILIAIVLWIILYKFHKKWKPEYEDGGYQIPCMIVAVIVLFLVSLFTFTGIGNVINGYFHPEYWALKEILDQIN